MHIESFGNIKIVITQTIVFHNDVFVDSKSGKHKAETTLYALSRMYNESQPDNEYGREGR